MGEPRKFRRWITVGISLLVAIVLAIVLNAALSWFRIEPDEYRVSDGRAKKFQVQIEDPYLRAAVFVKLKDGTLQRPRMHYYQFHFTAIGGREVEKPARLTFQLDNKTRNDFIYLPIAEEIDLYLILIKKPIARVKIAKGRSETRYTDWTLLKLTPEQIDSGKPLVLPAFENLAGRELSAEDQRLLQRLSNWYDQLHIAGVKKANTPVKSRWSQPWWAW